MQIYVQAMDQCLAHPEVRKAFPSLPYRLGKANTNKKVNPTIKCIHAKPSPRRMEWQAVIRKKKGNGKREHITIRGDTNNDMVKRVRSKGTFLRLRADHQRNGFDHGRWHL